MCCRQLVTGCIEVALGFKGTSLAIASYAPQMPLAFHSLLPMAFPQIDSEDLVYSLEILVQKFGEDIAPFAAQVRGAGHPLPMMASQQFLCLLVSGSVQPV
jgi:hypothetical protein